MTIAWCVLIVIFAFIIARGLPGAWRKHKMHPVVLAIEAFTEAFKGIEGALKRTNVAFERLGRAIGTYAEAQKGRTLEGKGGASWLPTGSSSSSESSSAPSPSSSSAKPKRGSR